MDLNWQENRLLNHFLDKNKSTEIKKLTLRATWFRITAKLEERYNTSNELQWRSTFHYLYHAKCFQVRNIEDGLNFFSFFLQLLFLYITICTA
jgi:hypothetical protein